MCRIDYNEYPDTHLHIRHKCRHKSHIQHRSCAGSSTQYSHAVIYRDYPFFRPGQQRSVHEPINAELTYFLNFPEVACQICFRERLQARPPSRSLAGRPPLQVEPLQTPDCASPLQVGLGRNYIAANTIYSTRWPELGN